MKKRSIKECEECEGCTVLKPSEECELKGEKCPCKECLIKVMCSDPCDAFMKLLYDRGLET